VIDTSLIPQQLPEWLLDIYPKRYQPASNGHKPSEAGDDVIPEGQRDAILTRIAGAMRRQGLSAEEMVPSLLAVNAGRCQPPLPEEQVWKITRSVGRYEPGCRRNVDRVTVSVF